MFLVLPLVVSAAEHVPWELEGAQQRIEKYRIGDGSLQLVMPDGSTVSARTKVGLLDCFVEKRK